MKRFTTQDIVTIITLSVLILGVLFMTLPAQAGEKISLWGPSEPVTQQAPAPVLEAEPIHTPKSAVDTVEGVIQKGEAIEQQGRRLKRLLDR